MANVLKMALIESIGSLLALRYSQRRIARELVMDREGGSNQPHFPGCRLLAQNQPNCRPALPAASIHFFTR
jgi:hypothetical protein